MTNRIFAILLVLTMITGCSSTMAKTPTDTAPSKLDPKPVGVVSSESSAPAESTEESKGETSSQTEIGTNLVPEKSSAPAKDEKPATSTVQKPNKTNKPSNNVSSKPQNNSAAEEDEMLVVKHDIKEIEKAIAKYINQYRVAEGKPKMTYLYGKANQYARLRSEQLVTDFSHDTGNIREVAEKLQFGEYVELDYSSWDPKAIEELKAEGLWNPDEYSYWQPPGSEAIGRGEPPFYFSNDEIGKYFAQGIYKSKGHWRYVGAESNLYTSVGVVIVGEEFFCTVYVSSNNIS